MPRWASSDSLPNEMLGGFAKLFGSARAWFLHVLGQMGYIGQAVGPALGEPDYLEALAIDLGTHRQDGESDVALRFRLRNLQDVVTPVAIQDSLDGLMDSLSVLDDSFSYDLGTGQATFATNEPDEGVGGEFVDAATTTFEPDDGFSGDRPPYSGVGFGLHAHKLTISGAAIAGNDCVDATITGIEDDAAVYVNATAASDVDATAAWRVDRYGQDDAHLTLGTGAPDAFLDRGFRIGALFPAAVVILPYSSPTSAVDSTVEMLRRTGGFGVAFIVERREIP